MPITTPIHITYTEPTTKQVFSYTGSDITLDLENHTTWAPAINQLLNKMSGMDGKISDDAAHIIPLVMLHNISQPDPTQSRNDDGMQKLRDTISKLRITPEQKQNLAAIFEHRDQTGYLPSPVEKMLGAATVTFSEAARKHLDDEWTIAAHSQVFSASAFAQGELSDLPDYDENELKGFNPLPKKGLQSFFTSASPAQKLGFIGGLKAIRQTTREERKQKHDDDTGNPTEYEKAGDLLSAAEDEELDDDQKSFFREELRSSQRTIQRTEKYKSVSSSGPRKQSHINNAEKAFGGDTYFPLSPDKKHLALHFPSAPDAQGKARIQRPLKDAPEGRNWQVISFEEAAALLEAREREGLPSKLPANYEIPHPSETNLGHSSRVFWNMTRHITTPPRNMRQLNIDQKNRLAAASKPGVPRVATAAAGQAATTSQPARPPQQPATQQATPAPTPTSRALTSSQATRATSAQPSRTGDRLSFGFTYIDPQTGASRSSELYNFDISDSKQCAESMNKVLEDFKRQGLADQTCVNLVVLRMLETLYPNPLANGEPQRIRETLKNLDIPQEREQEINSAVDHLAVTGRLSTGIAEAVHKYTTIQHNAKTQALDYLQTKRAELKTSETQQALAMIQELERIPPYRYDDLSTPNPQIKQTVQRMCNKSSLETKTEFVRLLKEKRQALINRPQSTKHPAGDGNHTLYEAYTDALGVMQELLSGQRELINAAGKDLIQKAGTQITSPQSQRRNKAYHLAAADAPALNLIKAQRPLKTTENNYGRDHHQLSTIRASNGTIFPMIQVPIFGMRGGVGTVETNPIKEVGRGRATEITVSEFASNLEARKKAGVPAMIPPGTVIPFPDQKSPYTAQDFWIMQKNVETLAQAEARTSRNAAAKAAATTTATPRPPTSQAQALRDRDSSRQQQQGRGSGHL